MKSVPSSLIMRLVNALGFQLGWWLCVLSVRHDFQAWALAASLLWCVVQWRWSAARWHLISLTWRVAGLGVAIDSVLQAVGWIHFQGWALGPLAPYWLWAIWIMFAFTLNESMAFLSRLPLWVQALTGLVVGPLSYGAGAAMGAAALEQAWAWMAYALTWMWVLPLVLKWARLRVPVVRPLD
jgi:Protein of unknown function (DUF2878)